MKFLTSNEKDALVLLRGNFRLYGNGFIISTRFIGSTLLDLEKHGLVKLALWSGESCRVSLTEIGHIYSENLDLPIA